MSPKHAGVFWGSPKYSAGLRAPTAGLRASAPRLRSGYASGVWSTGLRSAACAVVARSC